MCEVGKVCWCNVLYHSCASLPSSLLAIQIQENYINFVPQQQTALDSVLLVLICRFTSEERVKHHPCAFLPFEYGSRNCIGIRFTVLQLKMALIELLTHYKMEQFSITKVPLEHVQGVTIVAKDGVFVTFKPRT